MLQTALTNAGSLNPGDTVWVQGGTYSGAFVASVVGAANAPITFRNFNHEEAVIDGSLNTGDTGSRGNLWLWGLEFIDSQKTTHPAPYNTVTMNGTGDAMINCLIHDCCIGIAPHGPTLVYGNILWNCGKDSGLEHGIYVENEPSSPTKIVQDNLIGTSSGFGIQAYGSAGNLYSMHFLNNALWQNGKYDILFGGSQPIIDGQLISNYCCSFDGSGGIELGYKTFNSNAIVADNYLYGSTAFELTQQFQQLTFTNNILFSPEGFDVYAGTLPSLLGGIAGQSAWDYNKYYKTNFCCGRNYYCGLSASSFLGAGWTLATGCDLHSLFDSTGYPLVGHCPPDMVVVRPNAYEPKRGHVIVWNFSGSNNVPVDLSAILSPGDRYVVRSALNYFAGPLLSNVYSGGKISLPMTNQTLAPLLYYNAGYTPANITSNFNVFVVMGLPNGNAPMSLAAASASGAPSFILNIIGAVGATYQVQWTANLGVSPQWSMLTNVTLQSATQSISDLAPMSGQRFYRAVPLPPPTWWLMP